MLIHKIHSGRAASIIGAGGAIILGVYAILRWWLMPIVVPGAFIGTSSIEYVILVDREVDACVAKCRDAGDGVMLFGSSLSNTHRVRLEPDGAKLRGCLEKNHAIVSGKSGVSLFNLQTSATTRLQIMIDKDPRVIATDGESGTCIVGDGNEAFIVSHRDGNVDYMSVPHLAPYTLKAGLYRVFNRGQTGLAIDELEGMIAVIDLNTCRIVETQLLDELIPVATYSGSGIITGVAVCNHSDLWVVSTSGSRMCAMRTNPLRMVSEAEVKWPEAPVQVLGVSTEGELIAAVRFVDGHILHLMSIDSADQLKDWKRIDLRRCWKRQSRRECHGIAFLRSGRHVLAGCSDGCVLSIPTDISVARE